MNNTIKEQLKKINEQYTPERIQKSKERWLSIDRREKPKDRYPFSLGFPYFNPYNVNHPPKERLESYLEAFCFLYQFEDDTIPTVFPGLNHASIPSMFGAKETRCGIETSAEKLIFSIEDIKKLPEPAIGISSAAYKWLEMANYIKINTESNILVSVCDMQGPFDACAQMWSYDDMFITAYEEPDSYYELLTKITDAFIILWNSQKEILGDTFVGTHLIGWGWVPQDRGVAVSADSLVMISPNFYNEFYRPILKKVYNALGPITLHSCGNFTHLVKELCETPEIKAINASQLTIKQLVDAGLTSNKSLLVNVDFNNLENEMEIVKKYNISPRIMVNGVWPTGNGKDENPTKWSLEDIVEAKRKIEVIKEIMTI